ncbi:hypothetical protein CCACVL1_21550 [Corchorus capsularis]|uniref:Uncharacterized protein n=1 Tax=Corchorus capsularis TaxID=210143 RepID=A0A1R3H4M4_COCAP|nr:hypothetical protein CCACVL1_21550 [Corchorus capsularis]
MVIEGKETVSSRVVAAWGKN